MRVPAKLIRRIALSGATYRAYLSRDAYRDEHGSKNWSEWAKLHPDQHRLLTMAVMSDE